ncbi:restriction endonuclease subunit S [Raoultella terrigena]|uniref:restriction endonuclease subunit S n=1 Tax=Enterobacterales TaxID=91347 RepID=UPI00217AD433|nr:restriction endonuclease subunit S [Serratia liquefaciens]CAI2035596.1 Type I restriction enzyme EcoKI specificity protein [Serratia liquefaciens]
MSDLIPKGWVLGKTSDFVINPKNDIVDGPFGANLKASEYQLSGTPIIRLQNIKRLRFIDKNIKFVSNEKAVELSRHSYNRGDIIITKLGDPLGLACIIPDSFQDGIIVADLVRLRTNVHNFDKRYLTYVLNSPLLINQINKNIKGTTRPRINLNIIRNLNIPITSIFEQKMISDKLDALLARVDSIKFRLENILEILKKFRQSVLISAFSGNLTEEWRSKNIELKPICLKEISEYWSCFYKKNKRKQPKLTLHMGDAIGGLPETWLDTNIGCVFDVHVGATPSRNVKEYWDGDFPWVSSSEVAFCRIRSTKEQITKLGLAKTSTNLHPAGTVMLAMIGQGKTRGQAAILDIEACHNQNTAALRVPNGFVISEFLYLFLEKQYEETRRIGGGNNQQALNKSFVQSLAFPLPPLEEQVEIVKNVEKLFHYSDSIQKKTNNAFLRINQITQSILAKAFRGELTEQWREENPDLISGFNSAEALLQKISTEKLASGTTKKIVKKVVR